MTLGALIIDALVGAIDFEESTKDIERFKDTWHDLLQTELEDLDLKIRPEL